MFYGEHCTECAALLQKLAWLDHDGCPVTSVRGMTCKATPPPLRAEGLPVTDVLADKVWTDYGCDSSSCPAINFQPQFTDSGKGLPEGLPRCTHILVQSTYGHTSSSRAHAYLHTCKVQNFRKACVDKETGFADTAPAPPYEDRAGATPQSPSCMHGACRISMNCHVASA